MMSSSNSPQLGEAGRLFRDPITAAQDHVLNEAFPHGHDRTSVATVHADRILGNQSGHAAGGRVVFLSLISKGQGYFVDSKADEEKLRALVGMYRGANFLLTPVCYLAIMAPASLGYNLYAGAVPLRTKLITAGGTGLFWLLCLGTSTWMLWRLYKTAVAKFTYAMKEVGPGEVAQLSKAPRFHD
jgi:hypothetical protein